MAQNSDLMNKNIITELGLQDLADERKFELLNKMSNLIQTRVLLQVIKSLSVADKEQFNKLLGKENDQEIYRFLISKVPEIEQITEEEVIKFKKEVLDRIKDLNL
ncbi:MAG: DUF5663 domain-containing protein [bacterium]